MASPTKHTLIVRRRKVANQGKERKSKIRRDGTTLSPVILFTEGKKA